MRLISNELQALKMEQKALFNNMIPVICSDSRFRSEPCVGMANFDEETNMVFLISDIVSRYQNEVLSTGTECFVRYIIDDLIRLLKRLT